MLFVDNQKNNKQVYLYNIYILIEAHRVLRRVLPSESYKMSHMSLTASMHVIPDPWPDLVIQKLQKAIEMNP